MEITKKEILETPVKRERETHSWEEDCIEIAAAIKRAIKKSGMSREQVVDAVNGYYGWGKERDQRTEDKGRKTPKDKLLSIHMFNHYLSKPAQYPIPSYLIYAIQRITRSLEPCRSFAGAEDAKVISGDEVRHMTLGKIDENILRLQKLKKELSR